MNLPPQIQQQLMQMTKGRLPVRARLVNVVDVELDDGQHLILCSGTREQALRDSGIALATAETSALPQSEVFEILTTFLQIILVNGARAAEGPRLQFAQGGAQQLNVEHAVR